MLFTHSICAYRFCIYSRSQVGSSIIGPISGATDERMAEAIEAASVVIVCVSKQYKESANCRMEAKYANQRLKKGKLKIVYVMMQEEYTTVSCEDTCDVRTNILPLLMLLYVNVACGITMDAIRHTFMFMIIAIG